MEGNNWRKGDYQRHDKKQTSKSNSFHAKGPPQNTSESFLSESELKLNQVYYGEVMAIIDTQNRWGFYCRFGLNKNQCFQRHGFVKKILRNNEDKPFKKHDIVKVICINLSTFELVLTPEYVRPLLILDINGPLGNREPYVSNTHKRTFIARKYFTEFLSLCSQYYEIAIWSCAKKNNIELDLFVDIPLYFVWSQEESTSLYPRTSFISPAKVSPLHFTSFLTFLLHSFIPSLSLSRFFFLPAIIFERIRQGLREVSKLQLFQHSSC